jgi:predicted Zn-ribbon and HTH transcriptional regulator
MPEPGNDICEDCGLEFDESEINSEGLCEDCAKEYEESEDDDDDTSS